jgi:hypothetical protein
MAVVVRKWSDSIQVRQYTDGYFDATTLATMFDKRVYEYLRLPRTSDYIEKLAKQLHLVPTAEDAAAINALVVTQRGGPNQGSRFHPRLMIDYGRWLDSDFAIWMDEWVFEFMCGVSKSTWADDFDSTLAEPERLFHNQAVLLNETDLHQTVVKALRTRWPLALFAAGLGELQITSDQRIEAWRKGYMKGQPDLVIFELRFCNMNGCIESLNLCVEL